MPIAGAGAGLHGWHLFVPFATLVRISRSLAPFTPKPPLPGLRHDPCLVAPRIGRLGRIGLEVRWQSDGFG